jgi:SAM-dependent methyltransferase
MKPNNISYKDSAARVVQEDGIFYRYIFDEYQAEYDHLMQSGLYKALLEKGYIIAHEELAQQQSNIYKKLLPKQIAFQSYPFEWSYGQWRKVVYAYLQINKIALAHGMLLKDATPFNFYFEEGEPVLLDTSSFMFFQEGAPWIAYKQFCTEMLSPLALMRYNGQRWSKISMSQLRGLPLNFVSKQLPLKSWLNSTVLLHIHLHGKYANAEGETKEAKETLKKKSATLQATSQEGFSKEKLMSLTKMIQETVVKWKQAYQFEKHWLSYYQNDISSDQYLSNKEAIIREWLQVTQPKTVLDLGANTGRFSLIASEHAQQVIAIESDDICVDAIDKAFKNLISSNKKDQTAKKQYYTLQMDLAETTPNMGVLEQEYGSIYTRAKSTMVFALALTHHLYISNQLSFDQIATMLDRFSEQYCITEFVPATDDKVQMLIKDKQRAYLEYTEEEFTKSLEGKFTIKDKRVIEGSERILFLLEIISR